jgi:hypothetical protein
LSTRNSSHRQRHTEPESGKKENDILYKQNMKAGIVISDKAEFKPNIVKRNKKGHFIIIKRTIHPEDITIVNYMQPTLVHPIS